jgi:hypothetical protein
MNPGLQNQPTAGQIQRMNYLFRIVPVVLVVPYFLLFTIITAF